MDEREFELLNIIGKQLDTSQRYLSKKMDLSLGMINMLIRRMITKGYLRIEQLDKRKVQYLLTPKGFAEKMRKSVKYTMNTLNHIGMIKDNVKDIFERLYAEDYRKFYVYCEHDLTLLIEKAFHELPHKDVEIFLLKELPSEEVDGFLLTGFENIRLNGHNRDRHLDILQEIAQADLSRL